MPQICEKCGKYEHLLHDCTTGPVGEKPFPASAGSPQIPEILFDGYAVLKEVEARQNKLSPPMPTWEQVSIVLDAIVAIMKRR